jgi:rsbT antagonist protein RsbS
MSSGPTPAVAESARELVTNRLGDCLVVILPDDLGLATVDQVRSGFSKAGEGVRGVILDCSGLEVLDIDDYQCLQRLRRMFSLLGARTVLMGLKPGVVSALIGLGCDGAELEGVLGLENALAFVRGGIG